MLANKLWIGLDWIRKKAFYANQANLWNEIQLLTNSRNTSCSGRPWALRTGNHARKLYIHWIFASLLGTHQWPTDGLEAFSELLSAVLLQMCFRFPISVLRWAVWNREQKLDWLGQGNLVSSSMHRPRTPAHDNIEYFSFHRTGWTANIRHPFTWVLPRTINTHLSPDAKS